MVIDPSTTKYMIKARITTEGIVEKPDVVGAIFGQTGGLIGDELDLRDLQKSGRIGRIEVELTSSKGKSEGIITVPSSLDQVETAILAAALETIDRVGPCKAKIEIESIEDVRATKRQRVIERAKELLAVLMEASKTVSVDIIENVRSALQEEEIVSYGPEKLPAGPDIDTSDTIIIVEGRSDVLNLLKHGIKNAIAVEGTNIPKTIQEISKEKFAIAFVDGDRGGELILRELLQVAEIDFVCMAPKGREVEELTYKQITKSLRNKIPVEQYIEMYGIKIEKKPDVEEIPTMQPVTSVESESVSAEGKMNAKSSAVEKVEENIVDTKRSNLKDTKKEISGESAQNLRTYKEILTQIEGKNKAILLDKNNKKLKELPIRELRDNLGKKGQNITAIVFDGIITQTLVDLAASSGVRAMVGLKKSNVTKMPSGLRLYTKADLS